MLFEKDVAKNKQLEILREEVAKGFEQLAAGESSKHNVMVIFEHAFLSVASKSASNNTHV
ncbi:MAG: antitoxin ParD1/3/4 [Alteromonadaceae bacterium]|jgi:antitoxin ParD1/3/4